MNRFQNNKQSVKDGVGLMIGPSTTDFCKSGLTDARDVPLKNTFHDAKMRRIEMNGNKNHPLGNGEPDIHTITKPEQEVKEPSFYKVVLLNDDFTPMEFVIDVLVRFFKRTEQESARIMMEVHNQGAGIAGVYPFEIAETKVMQVNEYSHKHRHPLKCIMEEDY